MGQQTLIWKQNIHLTGATPNHFFFIFSESSVDSWNLLCYLWSWIYITLDYNVILFIGKYVHFDKAKVSFLKILIWQKCTFDKANVYFLIRQKCHRQTIYSQSFKTLLHQKVNQLIPNLNNVNRKMPMISILWTFLDEILIRIKNVASFWSTQE